MARLEFEWDDEKAELNFEKHGVSFRWATQVFTSPESVEIDATRAADGEARRKVVGMIGDTLLTVVYTLRGDTRRLISARRANVKEKRWWLDSR
jgi:uncharacterized DUF497 family protein